MRDGLPYVASNTDMTIPTPYGLAPGHGVLVQTISGFAGVEPTVAGKPEKPLMEETVRRVGGDRPLMVGDRLDTDIEGAHAIDVPSLLVLTGVSWLEDLAAATPELRPTYISPTLEGLFEPHPVPDATTAARSSSAAGPRSVDDGRLDGRAARAATPTGGGWPRPRAGSTSTRPGRPSTSATRRRPGPIRRLGAE